MREKGEVKICSLLQSLAYIAHERELLREVQTFLFRDTRRRRLWVRKHVLAKGQKMWRKWKITYRFIKRFTTQ